MRFCVGKMSKRRSRTARPPQTASTCCFCGFSDDDEVEYGKLYKHKGIVTHYYCLLLSSNMQQNGKDHQGILGFMPADIQTELRRGKRLACSYCRKFGATLGCCNSRCKRVFHLPCGLQAGSLHQFFDEFRSYCITHRIKQEIDEHIKVEAAAAGNVTCYICYEEVNPQNTIRTLWAPCCRKNAWFHRKCVQRLALSAGYFFKCPLCNNNQEFQKAMLEHGIFIPNQDASWELVPNAYQELLHRHNCCDAVECLCPKGRSHTSPNAKWELVLCRLCGSQGVHKACGRLKWANSHWECNECVNMLHKSDETAPPRGKQMEEVTDEISDNDSSTDSDISVGQNPSPLSVTKRAESPPAITSPIRIRPGPLSFKLQQAVKFVKRVESTRVATPNTSTTCDILNNGSNDSNSELPNKVFIGEASPAAISPEQENPPTTESTSAQTISTVPGESSVYLETEEDELDEPKHRLAEVILIESDDEVEIISIKSKQTVLTTMDGTKIEIHNLPQAVIEQKVAGNVKLEYKEAELLKLTSSQLHKIPGTNGLILPKTSSGLLNTPVPTSTVSITPQLRPLNVPEFPVSSEFITGTGRKKLFENREDSDPNVDKVEQNSVMNLKITNVVSVPIEDFTNSDSPLNAGQQELIIQAPDQVNSIQKSRTTAFQLSSAAVKDMNTKRRSEEYKSAVSNPIDADVTEHYKRARISEPNNRSTAQTSTTYTWGINLNDVNGAIPIISTSVPMTRTSNSNGFEQSTVMTPEKPNESLISSNNGVRTAYSLEIQKKNGFHRYPSTTFIAKSVQTQANNNANCLNLQSNEPPLFGPQENSMHLSKIGPVQPQMNNRIGVTNVATSNINVHGNSNRIQQYLVNAPNLPDSLSRSNTTQGLTQPVFRSNNSIALTGGAVKIYQTPKNRNKEGQSHNDESGETVEKNLTEVAVWQPSTTTDNSLAKSSTENSTGSSGNQPNANNVFKTGPSIMQLANEITFHSGCDGDAGSTPAAEARPAHQAISTSQFHPPPESIYLTDTASGPEQRVRTNSSISTIVRTIPAKYVQRYSSYKTAGKHCDKPGLIPKKVPLQDLKFRVMESEIIEIVVSDNYILNMNTNICDSGTKSKAPGSQSSKTKENLIPSSTQQKFGAIKNDCQINLLEDCGSPKSQASSRIAYSLKESRTSTRSLNNPIVSKCKFVNNDLSNTAAPFTDGKSEASCLSKTVEGRDRSSLCSQTAENLSKEEVFSPAFSNQSWNLRHVYTKDGRILSNGKRKRFSDNMRNTTMKTVEQNNTAVDFRNKIHNYSTDEGEKKLSNGLTRVSKCSVENPHDSSKMNLSINYYSNYKNIVDRSPKLNSSIKDLDTGVRDLSGKNSTKNANLGAKNKFSEVAGDPKAQKSRYIASPNLNDCIAHTVDENTNFSVAVVNSKSINNEVGPEDQIGSRIDRKARCGESTECESHPSSIKVKINLNKVQRVVDGKPKSLYRGNPTKHKCTNGSVSETSPHLSSPHSFDDNSSKKRSYSSNNDYSNAKKRFKYNSG